MLISDIIKHEVYLEKDKTQFILSTSLCVKMRDTFQTETVIPYSTARSFAIV